MLSPVFTFLMLAHLNSGYCSIDNPVVKTRNGEVQGRLRKSYNNKTFVSFEGIPYAKPPIGELRFKEAVAAEAWDEILVASQMYTCPQFFPIHVLGSGYNGVEDCLYVNVYVPGEKIDPNAARDVVVHVHGGAFILGSPKMMAGPTYMMNGDVIYVSFNYRLGILGFLSTEDDVVPGNNGLKDQNLALKWIQDNIADFGGNPKSVTLTGLSAGSASVHYHMLSPKSTGLFHRAMCMSGTSLNPWSLVKGPLEKAQKLAQFLNCSTESNPAMVECLRTKAVKDIAMAIRQFFIFLDIVPVVPFGPVVEKGSDPFLNEHPYKLLTEGKIANDVPLILSTVQEEGIYPVGVFAMFRELEDINNRWNELMPYALDYHITLDKGRYDEVSEKIRKHYFGEEKVEKSTAMTLVKLFSDRFYYLGIQQAAKLQAKASKSPVYFYYFTYEPTQFNPFPDVKGTAHSDDSKLAFELITAPSALTKSDNSAMELLTNVVFSYAKTGVPNVQNTTWTPMIPSEEIDYLHIYTGNDYKMEKIEEFASTKFWDSLGIKENNCLFAS